jgi:hypothetical protein
MNAGVSHPPGFPMRLVRASNFMQLPLLKAAHANMAGAAQQEYGVLCVLCKGREERLFERAFNPSACHHSLR